MHPNAARLFRNGSNQALRIPREFVLEADEVVIYRAEDCLVIVAIASLRYGAALRGCPQLNRQLDTVLSVIETRSLEERADQRYGAIRSDLESLSLPIGRNGLLIGAHARAVVRLS